MILTIDIGNTSTSAGVFENDKLVAKWTLASDKCRSDDEYGIMLFSLLRHINAEDKIKGAIISSVVLQLTGKFQVAIKNYLKIEPIILSRKNNIEIKLNVEKPGEVGADRIANAFAAKMFYKTPAIVVDFGTATTFDIINKENEFIGGIITPGIKIQANALEKFTSKLPKVRIDAPKNAIGKNTIDAMLSGLVRGHAAMIDGMIEQCEKELGQKAVTIATGGYSEILSPYLKRQFDHINVDLTLEGLNMLYKLNK